MNTRKQHARFEVVDVAMQAVRETAAVVEMVGRRDADLARQMRRAMASVPLNLAEGNRRRGKDRMHFFRVAAGSADEVATALRIAGAFGYLGNGSIDGALALLDRVLAMTWRLTHPR